MALQTVLGVLMAVPAAAQLDADLALNPNNVDKDFMTYAVSGLGLFLLFIIFVLVKRKLGGGSEKFEPVIGMTISDVGTLKQKGLLTEEESRAVRAAMARQLTKQLETKSKPARGGGAEALLADPEIRRLEALAQERAAAKAASGMRMEEVLQDEPMPAADRTPPERKRPAARRPLQSTPPFTPAVDVLDELVPQSAKRDERPEPEEVTEAVSHSVTDPLAVSEPATQAAAAVPAAPVPGADASADDNEDDVQLPADVLTMAQLGLITPEELENIKIRARAKKRELKG